MFGDAALIRSVALQKSFRGKDIGSTIVNDLVSKAKEKNIKDIFLLTDTAEDFFLRKGFKQISREEVPKAVRASSEFTHICPVTAACMFLKLN